MPTKAPFEDTLIVIFWADACASEGWSSDARAKDFAEDSNSDYHTTGWVVKITDTHITVAQSVRDDGSCMMKYGELMKIPKRNIKAMYRASKGKKVKP